MRRCISLSLLLVTACGGGGGDPPPLSPVNQAPVISSSSTASVAENTANDFYQVVATDPNNSPVTLSISGTDAARFTLSGSGQIRFTTAPDFEAPADANQDNVYQLVVNASDGQLTTQLNLSITVTNAPDVTVIAQVGGAYTGARAIAPVPGTKLIFVGQEDGRISIVDPATRDQGALYLTVAGASRFLSIAPALDYVTSGSIYVTLLNSAGDLELRRYGRLNPAVGDPASADLLFKLPRPLEDRGTEGDVPTTGGWIGFGPDGHLYLTTASNTPARAAAQANLVGKVLRIDVSRDDFPADGERDYAIPAGNPFSDAATGREVYASGFRDPRSASFNGNVLIVGDQGGDFQSEINLVRLEDAGSNYGAGGVQPVLLLPRFRISLRSLVLGGYVYRGPSPQLAGLYIFYAGMTPEGIKSIPAANLVPGSTKTEADIAQLQEATVTAFGEDADRNVYFALGGNIYVYRVT